jgi:hypothetical protein
MNSDDGIVKLAHYQLGFQTRLMQLAIKSAAAAPSVEEFMEKQAMAAALGKILPLIGRGIGRTGGMVPWALKGIGALGRGAGNLARRGWGRFMGGLGNFGENIATGFYNQAGRSRFAETAADAAAAARAARGFPSAAPTPNEATEAINRLRAHSQNINMGGPRIRVEGAPNVPPTGGTAAGTAGAEAGAAGAGARPEGTWAETNEGPGGTEYGGLNDFRWPSWVPGWAQTAGNWTRAQAAAHPAWAGGIGGGIGGFGLGQGMDWIRDSARRRKLQNMGFMDRLMLAGNLAFSPQSFAERYM